MSNLLSNQKSIHSVSPLVASNGHEFLFEQVDYRGEPAWAYLLLNRVNGMWYIGISGDDPNTYTTSSENNELRAAFSRGEIDRYIIKVNTDYSLMQNWENQILTKLDAKNDPMSYNKSNGIPANKIPLPEFDKMKAIADQILEFNSFGGINPTIVDISKDKIFKNGKGQLKPSSPLNDIVGFQTRFIQIDSNHVNNLTNTIDDFVGNFDEIERVTKQKFLVIVLVDRLYKGVNVNLRIGGNHTWDAIIQSKFGNQLRILYIPKSMHSVWSDESIRVLSEYNNPVSAIKTLQTSEEDAIKTGLHLANTYGPKSTAINEYLKHHNFNSVQKKRIKNNITTKHKAQKAKESLPENFITYKDYSDPIIVAKKLELEKEEHTLVYILSSGKFSVGDVVQRAVEKLKNGEKNYKRIKLLVYHPDPEAKEEFDNKWIKMIHAWHWAVDKEKIESITYFEMPHLKEE